MSLRLFACTPCDTILTQDKVPAQQNQVRLSYWRLHYHLIWGTYQREPSLTPKQEKTFYGVLYKKGKELGLKIHAAGNLEDHVHVVVSIPPKLAIADCIRHLKGASASAINNVDGGSGTFKWQAGYGALSINEDSLEAVMQYAVRQKEHHYGNKMIAVYERIAEE